MKTPPPLRAALLLVCFVCSGTAALAQTATSKIVAGVSRFEATSTVDTCVGTVAFLLCIWLTAQWWHPSQASDPERRFG